VIKPNIKHQGFSLLESLLALALLSAVCIFLIQSQLHILRHIQLIRTQQRAYLFQASLAEQLRSCANYSGCKQRCIEQWQQRIRSDLPNTILQIDKKLDHYHICLVTQSGKSKISLQFSL
jgi:prepilin-type N-terminal cleavage/methylation domain-containing protein